MSLQKSSSFFAQSALLNFGEHRLFTSATVFDEGRRLMNALNMKKAETHYIAVRCIFPVANRPLRDMKTADTGQKHYAKAIRADHAPIFDLDNDTSQGVHPGLLDDISEERDK